MSDSSEPEVSGSSEPASRGELLRAVQRYQVERMRRTHEALFRAPGYGLLCEFFVEDLYGPRDFRTRTETFHSLAHLLRPVLGRRIYQGALELIELQTLSERLDERLVRQLAAAGARVPFSDAEFESAFRRCDDRADRLRQIELSAACTAFVHELSGRASTGRLLAIARGLGRLKRLDALLATLERGYRALRGVDDIRPFVQAMRAGETAYLDQIAARGR